MKKKNEVKKKKKNDSRGYQDGKTRKRDSKR